MRFAPGSGSANEVSFAPADTIAATNVQAAVLEALADARSYADAVASGLDVKAAVRCATFAALPANTRVGNVLTANANGAIGNLDASCAVFVDDRVLVKAEVAGENNGIYVMTSLGSAGTPWVMTRASDVDGSPETTSGVFTTAISGAHALKGWVLTTVDPIVLNTTPLEFLEFNPFNLAVGTFGSTPDAKGLTVVGNTITAQPADAAHPGMLTSGTQSIGGAKSFSQKISANAGIDVIGGIAALSGGATLSGRVSQTPLALTSTGASIALNAALGNNFYHLTTENTTLAEPTNAVAGQFITITITQGTPARALGYAAFWKFPQGYVPPLTATVGAVDTLFAYVEQGATQAICRIANDRR
jgi:hypothetical protein